MSNDLKDMRPNRLFRDIGWSPSLADGWAVGLGYIGLILRDTLIRDRLTAGWANGCYTAVTIAGPFGSSY